MNSGSYSASELRTQQVSIRSDSQSDAPNFCCIAIYDIFQRLKKCLVAGFELITSNCQEFERGRIIGLKEAGGTNWRIARHMGLSDTAIRRCWQEWVNNCRFQRHDGSGRPRAQADREDRLIVKSAVTAPNSLLSSIRRAARIRVPTMTIHR
ncbi:HTH_Tnp_Tc3_2 domain-containing protein [Trichonephila clavipes]|nr:HTH_Tnp_Tc3_2 domain-containing protein [Trichonephila clavipes]